MQVIFTSAWFAPSDITSKNKLQNVSGAYYHARSEPVYVPDSLREFLPSSAQIVDGAISAGQEQEDTKQQLHELDTDRAAGDVTAAKIEAAKQRAAHARAAKNKK